MASHRFDLVRRRCLTPQQRQRLLVRYHRSGLSPLRWGKTRAKKIAYPAKNVRISAGCMLQWFALWP
jgi:hypothetical protein